MNDSRQSTYRAIAICGLIASGKSSIANYLSDLYEWDIVSFGDYVRYEAKERNLEPSRETYQSLGEELFRSRGGLRFLRDVIGFQKPRSSIHLFESIRHVEVIEAVKKEYHQTLVIYISLSDQERYKRFVARSNQAVLTYDNFMDMSYRPIEQGIPAIAAIADFVVDGSVSLSELIKDVETVLVARNYL
jgi:dephospho-CoA kinase